MRCPECREYYMDGEGDYCPECGEDYCSTPCVYNHRERVGCGG